MLLPFITALPMLSRRRMAQTIGYGVMSILTMLLLIVFCSDLVRIVLPSRVPALHGLPTLGIAAMLALIGFLQARRPRVVSIDIPSDLGGYRIVQWSDVHIGPTIQRRFVESLVRSVPLRARRSVPRRARCSVLLRVPHRCEPAVGGLPRPSACGWRPGR